MTILRHTLSRISTGHVLAGFVAVMAVMALPVCHASAYDPLADSDLRTVFERQDVVEVMHTPGVRTLHTQFSATPDCPTCDEVNATDLEHPGKQDADDLFQRFADVTQPETAHITGSSDIAIAAPAPLAASEPLPEFPPPRITNS